MMHWLFKLNSFLDQHSWIMVSVRRIGNKTYHPQNRGNAQLVYRTYCILFIVTIITYDVRLLRASILFGISEKCRNYCGIHGVYVTHVCYLI